MRLKKAQVTIFIIVGIIILFASFFFLFIRKEILNRPVELPIAIVPLQVQPVKNFVDQCLEETSIEGIHLLASQGGYVVPRINSIATERSFIATDLPSITKMQEEIGSYVTLALPRCTDDFKIFAEQGMNITVDEIVARPAIGINAVSVNVEWPITVQIGESIHKLRSFTYSSPIRLGYVHQRASQITERNRAYPDILDLSLLSSLDLRTSIIPYDQTTTIFSIYDPRSTVRNVPFIFYFAIQEQANTAPIIDPVPDFVLAKGVRFSYNMTASDNDGDSIIFSDNSPDFDIDPSTGSIDFVPQNVGISDITITASDGRKSDSAAVRFTVR